MACVKMTIQISDDHDIDDAKYHFHHSVEMGLFLTDDAESLAQSVYHHFLTTGKLFNDIPPTKPNIVTAQDSDGESCRTCGYGGSCVCP